MSKKDRQRLRVLKRVKIAIMTLKEAVALMGVSYRQDMRINALYKSQETSELVHRSWGQEANRKANPAIKEVIFKHYEQRYLRFEPIIVMEKLRAEQ